MLASHLPSSKGSDPAGPLYMFLSSRVVLRDLVNFKTLTFEILFHVTAHRLYTRALFLHKPRGKFNILVYGLDNDFFLTKFDLILDQKTLIWHTVGRV